LAVRLFIGHWTVLSCFMCGTAENDENGRLRYAGMHGGSAGFFVFIGDLRAVQTAQISANFVKSPNRIVRF